MLVEKTTMGDAPEKFESTVSLISHQTAGDHRPIDSDVAITAVPRSLADKTRPSKQNVGNN